MNLEHAFQWNGPMMPQAPSAMPCTQGVARSALLLVLAGMLSAHVAHAWVGPGSYGHYEMPYAPTDALELKMDNIWTILANETELRGNAVFAATQMWFQNGK